MRRKPAAGRMKVARTTEVLVKTQQEGGGWVGGPDRDLIF
jgi:hypothetical protein